MFFSYYSHIDSKNQMSWPDTTVAPSVEGQEQETLVRFVYRTNDIRK